jgi:hypothetical protein
MGKRIITATLVATAVWAAVAAANLGSVVSSFSAPTASVRGLARSDTRLFLMTFGTPTVIYRVAPVTGSVYGSWTPSFGNNCRGLAFSEGGHLWVGNYGNDYVYDCAATTGSVYGSWSAGHNPYGLAPYCTADGGVGTTAIFSSDANPSNCWRHNMTTGSILSSFEIVNDSFFDIAWDHRNRLVWMGDLPNVVYGYATGGAVRASFTVPATYPYGFAYYGQYLWVACAGNGYVYRVHCPGTVGVGPASLGKVKALFR